jgi:hypothetical protein
MKSMVVGALAAAFTAVPTLALAAPCAAAPTDCGTARQSWQGVTLSGDLHHGGDDDATGYPTRIHLGGDNIVDWWIYVFGDAEGHDEFWTEGNQARFRSDMGRGFGAMHDFTLIPTECDASGRVTSAEAVVHVPVFGVTTLKTVLGQPLVD